MFSVIIPLYNKAPYIQRALASVYEQGIPAAEIIVVNDGSTDGGERIAKSQRDPRVRVIDQPNRGVSVARNVGVEVATQPYVAFLDADDEWLPGFLERIKAMIGQVPDAGLYGTGFATVAAGRYVRRYGVRPRDVGRRKGDSGVRKPLSGGGSERPAFGPVDFFKVWSRGHVVHTSSMVVPKTVARAVGGFPAGVAICEDYEFLAKIALGYPVVLAPDVLVRYDVAVPGQAVGFWNGRYKERFEILLYHRFLAEELKKRILNTEARRRGGERNSSFVTYCRKEFGKALLQRLYGCDFAALGGFYRELGLAALDVGPIVRLSGWVANHPSSHVFIVAALRPVRWIRERCLTRRRRT